MAVERFTQVEFENVLSQIRGADKQPLFKYLGLQNGEHVYTWQMDTRPIRIAVRSSIDHTGVSADTGEDSIRIIVEVSPSADRWIAVGKGPDAYTTRVKGWETRLLSKIKTVFKEKVQVIKKPHLMNFDDGKRFNYVKAGKNAGRPFMSDGGNKFDWLD